MLDYAMQFPKIVARHGSVHVMFRVEVHVPVEELNERIQNNGAGAKSKIRHIVLESNMLGVIAEEKQPTTIEGRQCDQQRQ